MRNIAVIGIGGVGGYIGGKIAVNADPEDRIYFVARGKHLQEIKEKGLTLLTTDEGTLHCHPYMATDDISSLPQLDICLVCVKQYDLESSLRQLAPKISSQTKVMPILNGMDIYERTRKVLSEGIIYPACIYIFSKIAEPGIVDQFSLPHKVVFGADPQNSTVSCQEIDDLFNSAGIEHEIQEDPRSAIWSKYLLIASYALATASHDKTMGQIVADPDLSAEVIAIMNEIYLLAEAEGVKLSPTIVEDTFADTKGLTLGTNSTTSFHRDVAAGRKYNENDLFGPAMLAIARKHNLNIPAIQTAHERLMARL